MSLSDVFSSSCLSRVSRQQRKKENSLLILFIRPRGSAISQHDNCTVYPNTVVDSQKCTCIAPYFNPSSLSFSLSCINARSPTWKPFALIYEELCTIHIINLSPQWHSSAGIHPPFFILSVCYRVLWTWAKKMHSRIIKRFNRNKVWITILQLFPRC